MANTQLVPTAQEASNQVVKRDFTGTQVSRNLETSATAQAALMRATVEARYLMAMHNGRDITTFEDDFLKECQRPTFAAKAQYALPRGGKTITGPTIRFVEAALRHYRNIQVETTVIFESETDRIVQVSVNDMENNYPLSQSVVVSKTVERKGKNGRTANPIPPEGKQVIGDYRINSEGEAVWTVVATDDEVLAKQNSLVSKTMRTLALRILPSDIMEIGMATCLEVKRKGREAVDPDQRKREIIANYKLIGVTTKDLEAFIGHSLDRYTIPELDELEDIGIAIAEGQNTWREALAEKVAGREGDAPEPSMAEKLKANAAKPSTAAQAAKDDAAKGGAKPATTTAAKPADNRPASGPPAEDSDDPALDFGGDR